MPKNLILPVLLNPALLREHAAVIDFFTPPVAEQLFVRIHQMMQEMSITDFLPIPSYKTPAFRLYFEFRHTLFAALRRAVGAEIGEPPPLPACLARVPQADFNRFVWYYCEDRESGEAHYPRPAICEVLSRPENADLLEYVVRDPFGCHVFPGDIDDFPLPHFFRAMQESLARAPYLHLWAYIPTCRYKCHFCQFPTVIVNPQSPRAPALFRDVVDRNIQEARMWLAQLPALSEVPVGEFNLFGGTPSLLPPEELQRLMQFYRDNFTFRDATLRFEGEPGTLTRPFLAQLRELGFSKLSFGAQSFSDRLIKGCGRLHQAETCYQVIRDARELGFALISVDLMYGLPAQTVDDVRDDLQQARALDLSHLVFTKLHMKPFAETRTGVSAAGENAWQRRDATLPSLGQQYQMRKSGKR